MAKKRQLLTNEDAKPRSTQHKSPCSDCPWARKALPGWLGSLTADEWVVVAHGDGVVPCHTVGNQQCAGMAIYRANVCKSVRPQDPPAVVLPADRKKVFASPMEFKEHHGKMPVAKGKPVDLDVDCESR